MCVLRWTLYNNSIYRTGQCSGDGARVWRQCITVHRSILLHCYLICCDVVTINQQNVESCKPKEFFLHVNRESHYIFKNSWYVLFILFRIRLSSCQLIFTDGIIINLHLACHLFAQLPRIEWEWKEKWWKIWLNYRKRARNPAKTWHYPIHSQKIIMKKKPKCLGGGRQNANTDTINKEPTF